MKEENRKSKSASPKVTPGPDGNGPSNVKVEKRKQEEEGGEDDLAKRARTDGAVAAASAAEMQSQAEADHGAENSASAEPAGPHADNERASVNNSEAAQEQDGLAASVPAVAEVKNEDVVMMKPAEEVVVKQE